MIKKELLYGMAFCREANLFCIFSCLGIWVALNICAFADLGYVYPEAVSQITSLCALLLAILVVANTVLTFALFVPISIVLRFFFDKH